MEVSPPHCPGSVTKQNIMVEARGRGKLSTSQSGYNSKEKRDQGPRDPQGPTPNGLIFPIGFTGQSTIAPREPYWGEGLRVRAFEGQSRPQLHLFGSNGELQRKAMEKRQSQDCSTMISLQSGSISNTAVSCCLDLSSTENSL